MRIFVASMAGRLLAVSLILPSTVIASDIKKDHAHQNKNQNIITIKQGEMGFAQNKQEERTQLSKLAFAVRTAGERKVKQHNDKRLAIYKPRLEKFVPPKQEISILVTGYSSTPDQTWGDPFTTASGTRVHIGTMACPPQYPFGTKVKIEGRGSYICEDRGGAIKGNHFDMWFESRQEALQWGKRVVMAKIEK